MDNQYRYPEIGLLEMNESNESSSVNMADALVSFFAQTGIDASVEYATHDATGITYAINLGEGVRINRLISMKQEISVVLCTSEVQFLIPIPGTSFLGIHAAGNKPEKFMLGDVVGSVEFVESDNPMEVFIGRTFDGKYIPYCFDELPHLLISGTTGSGKSVFIDIIILSLLYKASPSELKLLLIDTRAVNFLIYSDMPHLLMPVATVATPVIALVVGSKVNVTS